MKQKPAPPLCRIITEGTEGTCPNCGSTESNKYYFFGPKIGCINPECENYKFNKQRTRKLKLKKLAKISSK
jgi:uncharacterized protein (DUF983 family)